MNEELNGGCACGTVRYQLSQRPMFVNCCHCDDCQRLTGSAFVINAVIETVAIKLLSGQPVAVPVPREDGPHSIYRCPTCQTAVWSDYGHRSYLRFVRVGTLDQGHDLKPDAHIFTRYKVKWFELPEGTPAFLDYYDREKQWPEASSQRLQAAREN